jgi:hypothetical protein
MTMFGLCWALAAGEPATPYSAATAAKARVTLLLQFICVLLFFFISTVLEFF